MNFVYRNSALYGAEHNEQPFIGQLVQLGVNFFVGKLCHLGHIERAERNFCAAHGLHYSHLEGGAYCHNFARGLHSGAQSALCVQEFIEGPLGQFYYHIVERGLEAGISFARDVVLYLVEGIAEGNLCGDFGNRVARSLGSQRRRTRNPGVYLYYRIFEGIGIERELAVAAALYAQLGYYVERGGAQHLVLFVRKRYGGRDYYRVARMYAYGVEVFHRADGEHVARAVAQNFELYLLPAADVLFDEHLRYGREHQAVVGYDFELLFAMSNAAARAAQRVCGAHYYGVAANLFCHFKALFHRICDVGGNDGLVYLLHRLFEELPVLRPVYRA